MSPDLTCSSTRPSQTEGNSGKDKESAPLPASSRLPQTQAGRGLLHLTWPIWPGGPPLAQPPACQPLGPGALSCSCEGIGWLPELPPGAL